MAAHDDTGEGRVSDDWLVESSLDALDDVFYLFDRWVISYGGTNG